MAYIKKLAVKVIRDSDGVVIDKTVYLPQNCPKPGDVFTPDGARDIMENTRRHVQMVQNRICGAVRTGLESFNIIVTDKPIS
jgi:hypothetical protein